MIVYVIQKIGGSENSPNSLKVMVNYYYHGENRVINWQLPSMIAVLLRGIPPITSQRGWSQLTGISLIGTLKEPLNPPPPYNKMIPTYLILSRGVLRAPEGGGYDLQGEFNLCLWHIILLISGEVGKCPVVPDVPAVTILPWITLPPCQGGRIVGYSMWFLVWDNSTDINPSTRRPYSESFWQCCRISWSVWWSIGKI